MQRIRVAFALPTAIGLAAGWLVANHRQGEIRAANGSRVGESITVSGPIEIQPTLNKMQVPLDAVYWLDYRAARLYATIPSAQMTATEVKVIRETAERELVADFSIAPGVTPHFLMNTASLGALGKGASVLLVFETTSRRIAVYQAIQKAAGIGTKPSLKLLQVTRYGPPPTPSDDGSRPGQTISIAGPVVMQQTNDKMQVPLDAVYWIDGRDAPEPSARLYATVPSVRKTGVDEQVISPPAERDLVADFKLPPGSTPHFLMNTSSLGGTVLGASVLLVFETTTKQVAAYRASPRSTIADSKPDVTLLQLKSYVESPPPPAGN